MAMSEGSEIMQVVVFNLKILGLVLLCACCSLCAKEAVSKKKVTKEDKKNTTATVDKQTDKRGISEILHSSGEHVTVVPSVAHTGSYAGDYQHGSYELGGAQSLGLLGHGGSSSLKTRITSIIINKEVQVPIPQPYPVHVEKKVPYPVPQPVPVPVVKHYPVAVPQPYPIPVEQKVPVPVEKVVPYPVKVPYKVPYPVPQPVHVPKPVPVAVPVPKPIPVAQPVVVKSPVPVYIDSHVGSHDYLGGDFYSHGGHDSFGHGGYGGLGHGGHDSFSYDGHGSFSHDGHGSFSHGGYGGLGHGGQYSYGFESFVGHH